MANTPAAKKDAKKSALRAVRNRSIKSAVKTKVTKFRRGVTEGTDGAQELAETAVSALDRAVSKGVLHKNNAARRKSRLMKRLNAVVEPAPAPAAAAPAKKTTSRAAAKPTAAAKPKATKAPAAKKPAKS